MHRTVKAISLAVPMKLREGGADGACRRGRAERQGPRGPYDTAVRMMTAASWCRIRSDDILFLCKIGNSLRIFITEFSVAAMLNPSLKCRST